MKLKFLLIALFFNSGLLQASDSKFIGIPLQDRDTEIIDYLQRAKEDRKEQQEKKDKDEAEKNAYNQKEAKRQCIELVLGYQNLLFESSKALSDPRITKNQLIAIGDNLLAYAKKRKKNDLDQVGIVGDYKIDYVRGCGRIYYRNFEKELYTKEIPSIREELFFAGEAYQRGHLCGCGCSWKHIVVYDMAGTACSTCCICLVPLLIAAPFYLKCPSQRDVQVKAAHIKTVIDPILESVQSEVESLKKSHLGLVNNVLLKTTPFAIATVIAEEIPMPSAPPMEVVMEAEEMKRDEE